MRTIQERTMGRGKYKGLTKRQYKKEYGSSTPGSAKNDNCQATGFEKGIIKYPRAYRTMPDAFNGVYEKKAKHFK
jgi:hypothetical protein